MSAHVGHWDVFAAELSDTQRGQYKARPYLPCVYCSKPTQSIYRVCCDHTDLLDLDPGAPSALEDTRAAQPLGADGLPQSLASPTALVSSSASPDRTNGDLVPGVVALDNSETA